LRKSKLSKSILSNSVIKETTEISIVIIMVINLKLRIAKNIIFFFTSIYAKTVMKTFTTKFMIKIMTITMMKSKKILKLKS
jgi:hypothetical protein